VGIVIYKNISKSIEKLTTAEVKKTLDVNSKALSFYIQGLINEQKELSKEAVFQEKDKTIITNFLRERIKDKKERFSTLYFSDISGKTVNSSGDKGDISNKDYYRELLKNGKGYVISRPIISIITGETVFEIAVMINDLEGKNIGILGGSVTLNTLSQVTNNIKIGESGYGWICDDLGTIIAHPVESERMEFSLTNNNINLIEDSLATNILNLSETNFKSKDTRNEKTTIYSKKIENSPNWTLIVTVKDKEINSTANKLAEYIFIYSLIGIIIVVVFSIMIATSLSKPIEKMEKEFNNLSHGNLNAKLDIKSKDEIGKLATNFNFFVEKLYNTINSIINLTSEIVNSNRIINHSMDNLINGKDSDYYEEINGKIDKGIVQLSHSIAIVLDNVKSQAASAEQSLAALEEITATSETINSNIETANKSFSETLTLAEDSSLDMAKMSDSMTIIYESTDKTSIEIEKLKDLSNNIGSIITAIDRIAEQTNLLALNAAIEAARAGEAGRGFSVVADEIRKLAEQTNKETNKIEELITSIQSEVEVVKIGSDDIKNKVSEGLELVEVAKRNMIKIIDNNEINANEIRNITNSFNEQISASKEINTAIELIVENSTEIESLSVETTDISDNVRDTIINHQSALFELEELINKLKDDLVFFKL